MYISNDCCLPDDWTKETLLNHHRSIPYNPNIAKTFYRCGYVETWGRGIQKIHEACKLHGTSIPEYSIYSTYMEVKFDNEIEFIRKQDYNSTIIEEKIICAIKTKSNITQRELAKVTGISKTTLNKHLKKMLNKELIERVEENSRIIKYKVKE